MGWGGVGWGEVRWDDEILSHRVREDGVGWGEVG